jgi:hypothetical protein
MAFVQIIEFTTTRFDEMQKLFDELRSRDPGPTSPSRGMVCADRDQPNRYVTIVEFPSYEEAMANSQRPETTAMAERMAALCDGPPTFRNLDVHEVVET